MQRRVCRKFLAPALALGMVLGGSGPVLALTASEQAQALGLSYFGWSQGRIPAFDANADGTRDLLLNAHNQERWWLMLGRASGAFVKSDGIPFKKYDLHGCVAEDFASPTGGPDGKIDLFCTVGANGGKGTRQFYKQLFVQKAPGAYVDMGVARGLGMAPDRGRDALAANLNGDATPDLVTAALGSPTGLSFNRAFVNNRGFFTELTPSKYPIRGGTGSECMAVLPKASRYDDVFYCMKQGPGKPEGMAHLRNQGGSFSKVTNAGYLKLGARKIEFADMNGDSRLDLIVLTGGELSIWFNNRADSFPTKNVSVPVRQGWAFAVCHLDNDRDLDIFVAQGKDPHEAALQRQDFALLNQGAGTTFTRMDVGPLEEPGNADWVTCLPNWQGTGHAMVYVTNGRWLLSGHNRAYVFRR